jgi:hypothetical protein
MNEISNGTTKTDPLLNDEYGARVVDSFTEVQSQLNSLTENLEYQFQDGEGESSPIKKLNFIPQKENGLDSKSEKEQLDEIINLLNDPDRASSDISAEGSFNNPSFDELEAFSSVKSGKKSSWNNSTQPEDVSDNDLEGGEDGLQDEEERDNFSAKVFELIESMKIRDIPLDDEWDNDDDTGYITVTLTDQEFFEYEDVRVLPFSPLSESYCLFPFLRRMQRNLLLKGIPSARKVLKPFKRLLKMRTNL